ncbi:CAMK family protein kinase [Histomonas meleagridis]|uniref:CAMK family protein kinase n=1 Tax=Histomonas meleagridis TaxID=135588 RepID=UPI003559B253|nr:CAMK family protein kinase [Histomonas meleagridis]KAH0802134.1 CAMK family protein kinase [Histomonas meleagridis]
MIVRRATLPTGPFKHTFIVENKIKTTEKVNQYLLISKIGYGSSSKVYLAKDTTDGSYYAAKIIKVSERGASGNGLLLLQREIRLLKKFSHPNIIKLHDVLRSQQRGTVYMFLEYADCGSLENAISNHMEFTEVTIASIFKQIVSGLTYLHEKENIVHRDIKPSNIILFSKGYAKLSDFGIGHTFQSADTVIGSPAYQAPELFEDEEEDEYDTNDPTKEDVWSLGVTLYQTVFGKLPYDGSNVYEIVNKIKTTKLKIPESHHYSESLLDLIMKMLVVHPSERCSLEEVRKHSFFDQAEDLIHFDFKPKKIKEKLNQIVNIKANVWDENVRCM